MDILILDTTSKSVLATLLEANSIANSVKYTVSYGDASTAGFSEGVQLASSNNTTDVTVCGSPSSGIRRLVRNITIHNEDSITHNIVIKIYNGSTYYGVKKLSLLSGETWSFGEASYQSSSSGGADILEVQVFS